MANNSCHGVLISGSASYGNDPVPLYEAGTKDIKCVIPLEALGQIQVSRAVTSGVITSGGGDSSFGGVTLSPSVKKFSITAQSGQAYFVDTLTIIGQHSG